MVEEGSMDYGYLPAVGKIRRIAKKLGFKGSIPVAPCPEPNTYKMVMPFNKATQDQRDHAAAQFQIFLQMAVAAGAVIVEHHMKDNLRSKNNSLYVVTFQPPA